MRTSGEMRGFLAVPRPIVGAGLPRPDLGGWWPSRLVATAAADCLSSKSPLGARRRAAQQHNMIRRIDLAERSRPPAQTCGPTHPRIVNNVYCTKW